MKRLHAVLVVAVLSAGCLPSFTPGSPPCELDEDCSSDRLGNDFQGYVCHDERCIPEAERPVDAGPPPDAGRPEAGLPDAGPEDASVDAGADAGQPDAQPADVGITSEALYGEGACTNGEDDDGDGQTDCDDDDCAALTFCAEERCDNNYDDNANGLTDCDEASCAEHPACQPRVTICDLHESGLFNECTACHSHRFDEGELVARASSDYEVLTDSPLELHDSLFRSGRSGRNAVISGSPEQSYLMAKLAGTHRQFSPACGEGDDACFERRGEAMPLNGQAFSAESLERVRRWIGAGDTRRCLEGFPVEDCEDGRDNDGDQDVDCDDRDCREALICRGGASVCDLLEADLFTPCIGCHVNGRSGGFRMSLDSPQALYDSLVGQQGASALPLIQAGAPNSSYLYLKVAGQQGAIQGGAGQAMPLNGAAFSDEQLALLRAWIGSDDLGACLAD